MKHFTVEQTSQALEKTARLLVQKGVRVTTQGARAFIEWNRNGSINRLNLPMIPRDASPEFLAALQGFLDHEAAHALNTDPIENDRLQKVFVDETRLDRTLVHGMCNIVEDVRIEACMERDFRGSSANLHNTREWFSKNFTTPEMAKIEGTDAAADDKRRAYVIPIYMRARGGQKAMIDYMDEYGLWDLMKGYDEKFPDLTDRLLALTSTADASMLAFEILRATNETTPPESGDPEPEDDAEDSADDESEDQPDNSEPEDDDECDAADKGDDAEEDCDGDADDAEDNDDGEGASEEDEDGDEKEDGGSEEDDDAGEDDVEDGDAEDDSDAADDADATGDEEADEEDEAEGSTHGESSDGDSEGDGEPDEGEAEAGFGDAETTAAAAPVSFDPDCLRDFDEALADALEAAVGELGTSEPYLPFTRDNDRVEPAPVNSAVSLEPWEKEVEAATGTLRRELQRLIAARSLAHHVSGFRRGKLHPGSLHKIQAGDDRVFSRKQEAAQKDTAFSLVVDLSGSMGIGGKVHTALLAAWAFADTLDRLRVPCEVIGFTTDTTNTGADFYDANLEEMRRFATTMGISESAVRWEPLYMPVFKAFDEKFGLESKRRIASAEGKIPLENNVDGECVRIAAARLYQRREHRKVMIVFSDGQPCAGISDSALKADLKNAVKEITRAGIEMVGIGINTESVKHYFPNHFVINKVGDLATTTLQQLKRVLAS